MRGVSKGQDSDALAEREIFGSGCAKILVVTVRSPLASFLVRVLALHLRLPLLYSLDFFGKKKCIYINIDLISSNSTFFLIFTWIKCIVVYNFKIYSHKCLSSIHFEDIFEYDSTE